MAGSDNLVATRHAVQYLKSKVVRFSGADVGAAYADSEALGMLVPLPPNVVVLRGSIITLTADGGTSPTFNVGVSGSESLYGANIAVGSAADVALAGSGLGLKVTEASTVAVTEGTGTISNDGDHILHLEYLVEGGQNEVYG